jgi:endonuclease-3
MGLKEDQDRARKIIRKLKQVYPDAKCSLDFASPFELLIATILAAQCTDEKVNQVTKHLFRKYPDARALAEADPSELEREIKPTGMFRTKARALLATAQDLMLLYGGEVPKNIDKLTALRGVGRKTANVVLGVAFARQAVVVDTHVHRLSLRLGFTELDKPHQIGKVEQELMEIIPKRYWTLLGHLFIYHGRAICTAQRPKCEICPILPYCPHGQGATGRQRPQKTLRRLR